MKGKIIVAVALIALGTFGIQNKAAAQRNRERVAVPWGGQPDMRNDNRGYSNNDMAYGRRDRGNYGHGNYERRRYNEDRGYRNDYHGRRYERRWMPARREYDNCNRRVRRRGYCM